jgi:hypothetical protein
MRRSLTPGAATWCLRHNRRTDRYDLLGPCPFGQPPSPSQTMLTLTVLTQTQTFVWADAG